MWNRVRLNAISQSENVPIGIDLGMQSACVCAIQNKQGQFIPGRNGELRTPCYFSSWADEVTGNWYHDVGFNAQVAAQQVIPAFPYNSKGSDRRASTVAPLDLNMNNTLKLRKVTPVSSVKRILGRSFNDPETQKWLPSLPYKVSNEGNTPKVEAESIRWKDQGRSYFPQQLSATLLQELKHNSEERLKSSVNEAVITVPANFSWFQRLATKDSALIAGFDVVHIINEPTAAAIAYYNQELPPKKRETVLVADLGSSTYDLTLLSVEGLKIKTESFGGDPNFGGDAFTQAMVQFCIQSFEKENRILLKNGQQQYSRLKMEELRSKCSWVKEQLSRLLERKIRSAWLNKELLSQLLTKQDLIPFLRNQEHSSLFTHEELIFLVTKQVRSVLSENSSQSTQLITQDLPSILLKKVRASVLKQQDNHKILQRLLKDVRVLNFHNNTHLEVELSMKLFHDLNLQNFRKCIITIDKFLFDTSLEMSRIDRLILVGASTQFPLLQQEFEDYFEDKVRIYNSVNPQLVVAYGAALQASNMRFIEELPNSPTTPEILSRITKVPAGFSVPFSIGIQVTALEERSRILNQGDFGLVIPASTQIPCSIYKDFLMPVNKTGICIVKVYVGESCLVSENTWWASFSLTELPLTKSRLVKVGFTMEVSEAGMLRVSSYCWNNKTVKEGTIVDAFHGRAMKTNFVHMLKQDAPLSIN